MSLNSTETVKLYLKNFRLPAMAATVDEMVRNAEAEAWSYSRLLQTLCETEHQQRKNRKLERLLRQSHLPEGKTLTTLNEELLPL
ncbi:MAG: ATP-binding protein [Deltaproteobacteria bacterium]|nr:ATP-binding protein [Deltaproteobacteria bacterium]